ncbi:hypothetical protein DRP43_03720 [candidate division TA06 bacterium]|uniref:Polymer-forming cytoskeletal protein n=1 Tax=candidate division TA06 bacterium TaxID=2250710 RepID=A0A660SJ14_UNCT6|nr:MAG: hypothetical protein DRP43_03720 [candidate division TA06 bacterium]
MKKYFSLFVFLFLISLLFTNIYGSKKSIEYTNEYKNVDVSVDQDDTLSNDAVSIGGTLDINGVIDGDAVSIGGEVNINGEIEGDLVVIGSYGEIDSLTIVNGEFVNIGSNLDIHKNAQFKGAKTNISLGPINKLVGLRFIPYMGKRNNISFKGFNLVSGITKFIILYLLSLAIILIFKGSRKVEETTIKNPFRTFLAGLLVEILVIPAIIVLLISIIGIPLVPFFILLLFIGVFFGTAVIIFMTGKYVCNKFNKHNIHPSLTILIGLLVLSVIPLIHFIGVWANIGWIEVIFAILLYIQSFIIITYSFGAVALSKFGTKIYKKVQIGEKNEVK